MAPSKLSLDVGGMVKMSKRISRDIHVDQFASSEPYTLKIDDVYICTASMIRIMHETEYDIIKNDSVIDDMFFVSDRFISVFQIPPSKLWMFEFSYKLASEVRLRFEPIFNRIMSAYAIDYERGIKCVDGRIFELDKIMSVQFETIVDHLEIRVVSLRFSITGE